MIPIDEFLNLRSRALDAKVLHEWESAADSHFIRYVIEHHRELDYQHLRCALRLLKNVDRADVRDLFREYSSHSNPGFRGMAIGVLDEQQKRGWCDQLAGKY
ncbi:MAG TPA: hypothetical protein VKX17_07795 [Planctomycetota bacterium]|nr:hypothetical protein [Planctomycetota bacterium]